MKDREKNQIQGVKLPPPWCSSLCRNAMNQRCVESCAVKRDCSAFEPKANLKLGDMPRFPLEESMNMSKEEKFTAVTVYLAKVVDHLKGLEEENPRTIYPAPRGQLSNHKRTITEVASLLPRSENNLDDKVDK